MAFTKIVSPGIDTTGSYTVQELNTVGIVTAGTVQVGAATTVHTTGIDLGSGNITSHNINSTGIITATSFVGPVTGNVTSATVATNAQGLTGSPSITVDDITATSGTFSGNVSIGGTLTYEDVTNIDSVGIITAQAGIRVTGGSVGIGTDNPQGKLDVRGEIRIGGSSTPVLRWRDGGSEYATARISSGGDLFFEVSNSEKLRIDSSGRLLIGTNTARAIGGESNSRLHIEGSGGSSNSWVNISRFANNTGAASIQFGKSRSDTPGTYTVVQNNDTLGSINFAGADGTDLATYGAKIAAEVDGTPGANDMPGRLTFYTTSDGSATLTERLRITSAGKIGIGVTNPQNSLHINGATPAIRFSDTGANGSAFSIIEDNNGLLKVRNDAGNSGTGSGITFEVDGSERLRITAAGKLQVPIGSNIEIGQTASSNHANGNAGSVLFGIADGGGFSGVKITNVDAGTYNDQIITFLTAEGGVSVATERLRITSDGKILKGIASSILGGDDIQLLGSGGPATVGGYWSNNNPAADSKMLSIRGYSQSGSTFTSLAEIDFRTDQNTATSSGSHDGSIVMRVNGGSQSGTWANYPYSFAGIKDRERLTRRSKRFYCLPEYSSGNTSYNAFREEWDYQHMVGYNQYSWYRFTTHSSSSSRGGSVDIKITWSTRHASGNGYGHYGFHWRDNHSTARVEIGNVYKYHQHHLSGSFYGWNGSPQLDVYETTSTGNVGGFYLRVQGYMSKNSGTYDGGVIHQFTINAHTNRYGSDVNKFEFVGNSTPSDVGSIQGNNNLP